MSEETKNEVAVYKGHPMVEQIANGGVSEYDGLLDLGDNMDGVEARLPQIKIVHQGQMFKFCDTDKKAETIKGIILDTNRCNAYWPDSFEGEGTPPSCMSLDGIAPMAGVDCPMSTSCKDCEQNQFGSDIDEKTGEPTAGKACKNMRRIHILLPESSIPYRLTLPPSALRAWDEYVTSLTGKRLPYQAVIVEISLKEAKNKAGIAYSEPVFTYADDDVIDVQGIKQVIKPQIQNWLEAMRGQGVDSEEA